MLDVDKLKIPTEYDKRIKIRKKDYPKIFQMRAEGFSMGKIGKVFGVSRHLIRFILNPNVLEESKEAFKVRRKDGRYYDKKKHCEAIKDLRKRKKELVKKGQL